MTWANFRGPTLVPDTYRPAARSITVNYSNGTANATTRHLLGVVEANTPLRIENDIATAFNTSAGDPAFDVVLENAAGTVLATLSVAASIAATVAGYNKCIDRYLTSVKCQVVVKFQRPATGNTTGKAVFTLTATKPPSQDASSATAFSIP